jgi:fibro-slime domain-containing protein
MKKFLKNRKGVIALVTMLVLMGVGVLSIGMVITSQLSSASANNYRSKLQTFSAADGVITLLSQDLLDFNDSKYFPAMTRIDSLPDDRDMGLSGGSYSFNNGTHTMAATGGDIQNSADQMHFAYGLIWGDCNLSVRVVSLTNSNAWAKAGIMIRQSLDGGSPNVAALTTPSTTNGVNFQSRRTFGGSTNWNNISCTPSYPVWLRLSRVGNNFTVSYSKDNITWATINKDSIAMTDPVYAGLAVSSHDNSKCTGVFDNLYGLSQYFCDTTTVGADSIPVIYTVTRFGTDNFCMSARAFKTKGPSKSPVFVSNLTQTLNRQRSGQWSQTAHDSASIPATFYDFRADNSCPEFQVPGKGMKNMVLCSLDANRKMIPTTPLAAYRSCILAAYTGSAPYCFGANWYTITTGKRDTQYITIDWHPDCINNCMSNNPPGANGWWFSDSINKWFWPSGDASVAGTYTFDPMSGQWSGLKQRPKYNSSTGHFTDNVPNEWVTTNWDSTKQFANIVMYDSLKFRQKKKGSGADTDTTIFTFGDSSWIYKQDSIWFVKGCNCTTKVVYWPGDTITMYFPPKEYKFMPLKNRGFGYDASKWFPKNYSNTCATKCNFSYTMELHRTFTYKPGQTFFFRGDDDVWVFINNKLVIDLGGSHSVDSENVNLDTIHPTLISGQKYWFDFFYCERDVDKSNIYISTNMLMFIPPQPLKRSWKRDYGNLD